jgi:hypothetical protein
LDLRLDRLTSSATQLILLLHPASSFSRYRVKVVLLLELVGGIRLRV